MDFIWIVSSSTSINTPPQPPLTKSSDDPVNTTKSDSPSAKVSKATDSRVPWKANVVETSVAMGPEYIIDNYREHREGGFYYDHRMIIPEMPAEYSVKPFETRKTGGNHPDTGSSTIDDCVTIDKN